MSAQSTVLGRPVVVAVRPGLPSTAALRFAAEEALTRWCPVHVVHVLPMVDTGAVPTQPTGSVDDLRRSGQEALQEATRTLRTVLGDGWPISTEFAHGAVARVLTDAALSAHLLVLQQEPPHHPPSPLLELVAARAAAPLVVVPASWEPQPVDAPGLVLVAVADLDTDLGLVRWGLDAARDAGARVLVLHAWWSADLYDQVYEASWPGWEQAETLLANLREQLVEALGPIEDIPLDVHVEHGDPRTVILEHSAEADLLVLGRHLDQVTARTHLGPVTKDVLHGTACPAAVVAARLDPPPTPTYDGTLGRTTP